MHHVLYLNERKTYYQKKTNESIKAKIKKIIIEKNFIQVFSIWAPNSIIFLFKWN